jgi:hypothetical protein
MDTRDALRWAQRYPSLDLTPQRHGQTKATDRR